jgi:hypothetical protein
VLLLLFKLMIVQKTIDVALNSLPTIVVLFKRAISQPLVYISHVILKNLTLESKKSKQNAPFAAKSPAAAAVGENTQVIVLVVVVVVVAGVVIVWAISVVELV